MFRPYNTSEIWEQQVAKLTPISAGEGALTRILPYLQVWFHSRSSAPIQSDLCNLEKLWEPHLLLLSWASNCRCESGNSLQGCACQVRRGQCSLASPTKRKGNLIQEAKTQQMTKLTFSSYYRLPLNHTCASKGKGGNKCAENLIKILVIESRIFDQTGWGQHQAQPWAS